MGDIGLPFIPSSKSLAMSLQRKKRKESDHPSIPHDWDDMKIPEDMKCTADGQNFCIMEERMPGKDQKIWGFASQMGIEVMKTATDWFIDGTFELVNSTLFKQLWVVTCAINETETTVPCAFYLLPCKEPSAYKMAFENLKSLGLEGPNTIHIDFESGEVIAARDVYPNSKIVCCDFHWKQALTNNISRCHLMKCYNEDMMMQKFVRYLWTLSLVPPDKVVDAWENFVCLEVPEAEEEGVEEEERMAALDLNASMDKFMTYFESTWIGSKKRGCQRKRPRYDISLWNKFDTILEDGQTTNNRSEVWNCASKIGMSMHPSIWQLMDLFKKEDAVMRAKLSSVALRRESPDHPGRKQARSVCREQLQKILRKWDSLSLKDYFNLVSAHYNYE